ncbi:MAG: hypothetical protein U1F66_06420 [bacterium]
MKKLLLLIALSLFAASAQAQVYTDDTTVAPPPPPPARYRLRQAYPVYPGTPTTSPDSAEVGRPYYYYPYPYGYPYGYPYPGVTSDGNSVYVPGK